MSLSGESHQSGFVLELHHAPCGLGYAMPYALCALRYFEVTMPAIASLEDLKAAQKELLETTDINELKKVFKKYRRIGWKNVCKLWLEERTPEQLKGEGG